MALGSMFVSLLLAIVGVRLLQTARSRRGEYPACAACGFDLRGRPDAGVTCSECAADLSAAGGIATGQRALSVGRLVSGCALCLPLLLVGISQLRAGVATAARPSWWLVHVDARRGSGSAAIEELVARATAGSLSDGLLVAAARMGLEHQSVEADGARDRRTAGTMGSVPHGGDWPEAYNELIWMAAGRGLLDTSEWKEYQRNANITDIRPIASNRSRTFGLTLVRRGGLGAYKLPHPATRVFGEGMIRSTRLELGGVEIPLRSADRSFPGAMTRGDSVSWTIGPLRIPPEVSTGRQEGRLTLTGGTGDVAWTDTLRFEVEVVEDQPIDRAVLASAMLRLLESATLRWASGALDLEWNETPGGSPVAYWGQPTLVVGDRRISNEGWRWSSRGGVPMAMIRWTWPNDLPRPEAVTIDLLGAASHIRLREPGVGGIVGWVEMPPGSLLLQDIPIAPVSR